jgi:putative phosphoesterase
MIKIGLLSDTHGHLDEKMLNFLNPVNEIWHAGDIGDINLLDKLKSKKKIRAVYGNIDNQLLRIELPELSIFTIENVKVLITHIGGYPKSYAPGIKKLLITEKPKLFISGHSHILRVIYDKDLECLHINPGAAGIQGFHKLRTMVRFTIDDAKIKDLEIWEYKR